MKVFYDHIREKLFHGKLTEKQVSGIDALFKGQEKHQLLPSQFAYLLATVYHETATTMNPVKERGGEAYLKRKVYYPYYGRDLVQTTWRVNYMKVKTFSGIDVVTNPDLIADPDLAVDVAFTFMRKGWYTGKKLADYITNVKTDYLNARRIINGIDQAELIKGYAEQFYAGLVLQKRAV